MGVPKRRETVNDNQGGPPLIETFQFLLYFLLGPHSFLREAKPMQSCRNS